MKFTITSGLALLLASAAAEEAVGIAAKQTSEIFLNSHLDGPLSLTQKQKTVICPGGAQNLHEGHVQYGMPTRFIIKNTASDPVIIAFVEQETGKEVSAANSKISPAQLDPEAVLAPGVTKVFAVHEGHVFHVRDSLTGELLLQHRAGLVPIENRYNHEIDCSSQGEIDVHDRVSYRVLRKFPQWKPVKIEEYRQSVDIPVGFHNTIVSKDGKQCPVNIYFVKKQDQKPHRKPNYVEKFATHLGANHVATAEDDALNAATKYQQTYIGHEFTARLAHDDNVVVDYITMAPIQVQDCSNKKTDAIKSAAHASAIIIPVGNARPVDDRLNETSSHFDAFVNGYNSTESRRGLYFHMHTE